MPVATKRRLAKTNWRREQKRWTPGTPERIRRYQRSEKGRAAKARQLARLKALPPTARALRNRFCKNWHDVTVVGRSQNGTCLECLKDAVRRSKAADPLDRVKGRCRAQTSAMQRRGELPAGPCEDCGKTKAENHHPDYTNPRVFIRLCRRCHARHRVRQIDRSGRSESADNLLQS